MKDEKLLKILEKKFGRDFFITTMEWPTVCLERGIGNNGMVSLDAYQSEGTYHLDITAVETLHPLTGYGHLIKVRTFAELIKEIKKWLKYFKENYNHETSRTSKTKDR